MIACLRIAQQHGYSGEADLIARTRDEYETLYRQLHAYRRSLDPRS